MISSAVLKRYARSLADIAFEKNQESEVTRDLKTYCEIFNAVPGLAEAFHSPALARAVKESLLNQIMALHPVSPITSNFLQVLLRHNRIAFLVKIFEIYSNLVNERKGIISAKVITALPLSPRALSRLKEKLCELTCKQVNIELQTDRELLGGLIVQLGSTVYDGSIRTQLSRLKRRLAEI